MTVPLSQSRRMPVREGLVRGTGWPADKVHAGHYERLAVVYVRQSDPQQVLHHQESTRLQYGLATRAADLGWAEDRVLVIDDDLGKSGTTTEGRTGFARLVAEVSLDHVGIILGVDMSRLARSCRDWYQLLEICALFGTLIADLDGIYDPSHFNDRLLLGMKGVMSETELHVMQQRLRQGVLAKARRGELRIVPPLGYVQRPSGEIGLDPDEQVQQVVRLLFRKFADLGTVNALLRYLVAHQISLGMRAHAGPERGEVVWHRPNRATLQTLLKHPMYAGAYVYGRRAVDPRRKKTGRRDSGRVVVAPDAWQVLLKDRVPAYISWADYEENVARLQANQARAARWGVVRNGPALLPGLAICAFCGCRMTVSYQGAGGRYAYACARQQIDYGGARCQQLMGACLDAFVSQQVLAALAPAALELSLEAASHLETERADLARLWQQKVERATYDAERAGRHYRLVEPENRLVARHLAQEWDEKLAVQRRSEEEYHRFLESQPRGLTGAEREAIRQLAANIPALWQAPTTTAAERKEIIRQVIPRVVVAVQGASEQVHVTIEWVGGTQTTGAVVRPVARLEHLSTYPALCARAQQLATEGLTTAAIAQQLNAEGYHPPKRAAHLSAAGVADLLARLTPRTPPVPALRPAMGLQEWLLADLAQAIDMPRVTLDHWIRRGIVTARYTEQGPRRWIVWADAAEVERLRHLHRRSLGEEQHRRWTATTAPTPDSTRPQGTERDLSLQTHRAIPQTTEPSL